MIECGEDVSLSDQIIRIIRVENSFTGKTEERGKGPFLRGTVPRNNVHSTPNPLVKFDMGPAGSTTRMTMRISSHAAHTLRIFFSPLGPRLNIKR